MVVLIVMVFIMIVIVLRMSEHRTCKCTQVRAALRAGVEVVAFSVMAINEEQCVASKIHCDKGLGISE